MDASAHFRGKKITIMGLGLLGRGVGDARYLAECGAELIVTDLKSREELADSVAQLSSFSNISFILGEHRLEDFRDRDLILKAAGVPLDSPEIAEAKKNGIPVRMSADLFAELSGIMCIGITGTRGKSTVAHMLAAILKEAGKKVLLGGNVRGVSTLALLKEVAPEHIAVLELDSWQLQGFGEAHISPHIAVFTTLYPDHLNYYRRASEESTKSKLGTSERAKAESSAYKDHLEQYLADKAKIFLFQKPEDTLILGKQCAPTVIEKYGEQIESKTLVVDELKLPDTWTLCIPGMHNRYNAALALVAARALEIPDEVSRGALASFAGVPGRLELIREMDGVKIYNDTTSTTPEATLAALVALDPAHTVLIMGGADKSLDMSALLAKLPEVKKVILLAGTGTDRIKNQLPESSIYGGFSEAVTEAVKAAEPGDTVLFSPAFASFGMFKNEFDRGDQFAAIVKAL
ncbi:MAG: UDP-N-acetylmuramoyl-L-alanine--D-glutamate ligase [Candidatus Paceibacterota bacterium]|jgi:UDP-N-acetylmuramoylalanine--D-glutamate ligase